MIEEFSGGYYRTKLTVQPFDDGPAIEQGLYDFIDRKFYYQTDAPITMRVGLGQTTSHFRPMSEAAMPTDVLALPEKLCEKLDVHPSAERVSVFILKPAQAYLFGQALSIGDVSYQFSDTSSEEEYNG